MVSKPQYCPLTETYSNIYLASISVINMILTKISAKQEESTLNFIWLPKTTYSLFTNMMKAVRMSNLDTFFDNFLSVRGRELTRDNFIEEDILAFYNIIESIGADNVCFKLLGADDSFDVNKYNRKPSPKFVKQFNMLKDKVWSVMPKPVVSIVNVADDII
jgi:hypothetical protein